MDKKVSIRHLSRDDAFESFRWRNDKEIWKLTVNSPDRTITLKDELDWVERVIKEKNSERFAIIYGDIYVGNIQLTNIKNNESYFGIFLGRKEFWGRGIAKQALIQILIYAFNDLNLRKVKLRVRKENIIAERLYKSVGFKKKSLENDLVLMELKNTDFVIKSG